jgi:uncharacterized protein (TIGR03437 family)
MKIRSVEFIAALALAAAPIYSQGNITTIAGTANCCVTTDGGAAVSTWLPSLGQMAIDQQGNLYFWDGPQIKKVNTSGIVSTVAGNGQSGSGGDGGPAVSARLFPQLPGAGLAIDSAGNLYLGDAYNQAVRKVTVATGIITTVAGSGSSGFAGDGGPATKAALFYPAGVAVDGSGNIYIADGLNNRVRKVTAATGIITTVAGNGNAGRSVTDGVAATASVVQSPTEMALDSAGNLYIAEDDRIRMVNAATGIIHTVAGLASSTSPGFSGDGGPATSATIWGPLGMVFDAAGNFYFADNQNQRIRKINTSGIISTFAGIAGNASSPLGDGGPATAAYIGNPLSLVVDGAGDLIFTASPATFYDIRKITPSLGLGTSPGSLSFAFAAGGTAPASQSISVSSTGAALSFTAAASESSGNWLSVSPTSGTTPATLAVSVNSAGLGVGTYPGTITVTPTGSGASALTAAVTLTVTGAGAPTIDSGGIVNATGYQITLAPDTVFVIFGSNLGPAVLQSAAAPNYPSNLGGTSIAFTPAGGGASIGAKLIYTSAGQIAGLLPSSITPGAYNVQVTYNSQVSAPQSVTVVARSFGIATSNSAGTGAAQATIGNVNGGLSLVRLTSGALAYGGYNWTLTPAHPGDTLVLWGTGGGADPLNDTGGTSGDQTAAGNFSVTVDGTAITPAYAGASSGYPGLWQINFALPATIGADCFASLQVSAGGQRSNLVTISIAAAGQTSCSSTIAPATLSKLDSGGNIVMAGLVIGESTSVVGSTTSVGATVGGVFNQYTAAAFLLPYSGPKVGACTILQETYPAGGKEPSGPSAQLDAGTLTISGPGLPAQSVGRISTTTGPDYYSSLSSGALQGGATYTLTGAGGTQVGPFTATAVFPGSFTVTNISSLSSINRAQGLTVNWSGTGFDQVIILIQGDILTTTTTQAVSVDCVAPASAGTYTIPAAALAYLPAVAAGSQNVGQVTVTASPSAGGDTSAESNTSTSLTPSLVGGGQVDFGAFTAYISFSRSVIIQ